MNKIQISDFARFISPGAIQYNEQANSICFQTYGWTHEHIRPVNKAYVLDLNTGKQEQITAGGYNESSISYLSDNEYLLLSNADNADYDKYQRMRDIRKYYIQSQLYKVRNSQVTKLTNFLHGVDSYILSPSKKKVLLTVKYYDEDNPENLNYRYSTRQLKKIAEDLKWNPIVIKNKSFKSDGDLGYKDESKRTLYLLDLETNELMHLNYPRFIGLTFDDKDNIYFYHFSKEGKLVIFKNNEPFITCNNIKPNPGSKIVFNNNYTKILLAVQKLENGYNQPVDLVCIPNEKNDNLSAEFVFQFDDEVEEGTEVGCSNFSMAYTSQASYCFMDDGSIVYSRGNKGNIPLFKVSADLKDSTTIIDGCHCFKGLENKAGSKIFALHTSSTETTQFVEIDVDSGSYQEISCFNHFIQSCMLSEAISFESNIHGWVMKPTDYEPNKKYPTILVVHGGPDGHYCSGFSLEMQCYAANGFAVIYSNPIGSSGYGKKHADMNPAFDDTAMNQLIDYCKNAAKQFDFIDMERIGITGGSYGGFETIYACGHSDFFKVGCALRPLGNFLMIANCSHSAGNENSLVNYPEDYTDYMADYVKQSPNSYADKIHVPFLIGAHEKDANCIPTQMIQLFKLLKTYHPDLPVRLILTPDSNHGLNAIGPLRLSLQLREEVDHWFKRYL